MFRTLMCPSPGACDCAVELPQASACNTDATPTQPHRNPNTHRTKNNTTYVVIQQSSRKLLMMDILMSETCWARKKWNKIASDIKLVFYSSTSEDNLIEGSRHYGSQTRSRCGTQILFNKELQWQAVLITKLQKSLHPESKYTLWVADKSCLSPFLSTLPFPPLPPLLHGSAIVIFPFRHIIPGSCCNLWHSCCT